MMTDLKLISTPHSGTHFPTDAVLREAKRSTERDETLRNICYADFRLKYSDTVQRVMHMSQWEASYGTDQIWCFIGLSELI